MALRKNSTADEEQSPQEDTIHRSNMGRLGVAMTLGGMVAQLLDQSSIAVVVLDDEGYVRFADPARVTIRPPTEEELVEEMLAMGASDEDILEALSRLKEWDGVPKEAPSGS